MPQWWNRLNGKMARWLWWVVLAGIIASLPVMYARHQTEASADQTALVIDYRDLLQIGATQTDPEAFVATQLERLMKAGVNGAVVYEATLEELSWAGETVVYNAAEAATLRGLAPEAGDNRTYVLFLKPEHEAVIRGLIQDAFTRHGAEVEDWSWNGRNGVIIGMGKDDAMLRPMQPNPIEIQDLRNKGLWVVPRLSDRFASFDAEWLNTWLKSFKEMGIDRIAFDGDAVPGFSQPSTGPGRPDGVVRFGYILQNTGIGIASFENLKSQVQGLDKLARVIGYNAIRAHSVTDAEMANIKANELADRIVLAVKDRNIRMVFLNSMPMKDPQKGKVAYPIKTILTALEGETDLADGAADAGQGGSRAGETGAAQGAPGPADGQQGASDAVASGGAVERLNHFGFPIGIPQAFTQHEAPAEIVLRGLAILGAIALTALVIGMFLPSLTLLAFVAGTVGGAGLYVLRPTLMLQALALCAAIAAPTAAVILLVHKLRTLRSDELSAGRRLSGAVLLYFRTAVLSLMAVPLVTAMLNDIAYSLVFEQFRGVSLLHAAPIGLAAIYVFLYGSGGTVFGNARRILATPVTVLWIAAVAVLGAAGLYYMSRTGNAGTVSGIELAFRSLLENTFGVRPRTKEFLIGHPLMLAGIFLALRHRYAGGLIVLATIAQLSMVDTFAHIHTPLVLSVIRVLLGLGLGLLIGLVLIGLWQLAERVLKRLELREAAQ